MLDAIKIVLKKFWPAFLRHKHNVHTASFYTFTNYRRIWAVSIMILCLVALSPLFFATVIHYQLINHSVDSELSLRVQQVTSNARRSLSFFMEERINALTFTARGMAYDQLADNDRLSGILSNLKLGFGGFTDLSVIDNDGRQVSYAGPFNLEGKNYKDQSWFVQSLKQVCFVSEIFTGYRDVPHIIIAVRSVKRDGSFFILRATLDTARMMRMLKSYETGVYTDIFLINQEGVLQTPSRIYGNVFEKISRQVPSYSARTQVEMRSKNRTDSVYTGYAYIFTEIVDTPFILMVHKKKEGVMQAWFTMGRIFNWIITISSLVVIIAITFVSTFMVNHLYMADRTKAETMLQIEQSQQLASIGQLAAGVAHEINNPLALINETAGYIKDLFLFDDQKLDTMEVQENLDAIIEAVERCGTITSQLLGFVRRFDIRVREIDLEKMLADVIGFHRKEAAYRGINVTMTVPKNLPALKTDSGKLQQILVNLVNNAFQAMDEHGCLDIRVSLHNDKVSINIEDTGCGISEENLKKIHEPFFTTKQNQKGTGLGLSITYGLVKKLHGNISVTSAEGVGTSFHITLPATMENEEGIS